jgi:hypothetical protein
MAEAAEGHVAPALVIEPQIARKPLLRLLSGLEGHAIDPFPAKGLDVDEVGWRPYRSALPFVRGVYGFVRCPTTIC